MIIILHEIKLIKMDEYVKLFSYHINDIFDII